MLDFWYRSKFTSNDKGERYYSYLLTYLVALTALYFCIKPIGLGAPMCTATAIFVIMLVCIQVYCEMKDSTDNSYDGSWHWKVVELCKLMQFVILLVSVATYYDGTNVVNRYRYAVVGDALLWDEALVHADSILLGRFFPLGQLALYLDTQPNFGVTSPIANFYHEILQVFYVSYYFWGNAIGVYFAYLYFYRTVYLGGRQAKKRVEWRRLQMFLSAWVGTFMVNFTFNLLFPAVSPRIYLADLYVNEIHGLWLTDKLRGALVKAAANTFSAFPSGHCGLSWVAALISYRCNLHPYVTTAQAIAACIISTATIVMRYHYFVDFLAGFILVVVGALWGSMTSTEEYARALTQTPAQPLLSHQVAPLVGIELSSGTNSSNSGSAAAPLVSSSSSNASSSSRSNSSVMSSGPVTAWTPEEERMLIGMIEQDEVSAAFKRDAEINAY